MADLYVIKADVVTVLEIVNSAHLVAFTSQTADRFINLEIRFIVKGEISAELE